MFGYYENSQYFYIPELKLPDDRPVELLPVLKLPLENELPDE